MNKTPQPLYDVGGFIRQRRKAAGLTQSALAALASLPDSNAVCRLEQGTGYSEMLGRLEQVATALEMTLPDLIRGAGSLEVRS